MGGAQSLGIRGHEFGGPLAEALRHGHELEPMHAAAAEQGQSCVAPSAASIFAYPAQYGDILRAVRHRGWPPHHVIIAEAFLSFEIALPSVRLAC